MTTSRFEYSTIVSNIKSPEQLGISSTLDPNILDNLNKNLSTLSDYNNALTIGSPNVFNNNLNSQPLGERYFMDSGFKCNPVTTTDPQLNPISNPGEPTRLTVPRNILIDNMKYLKNGDGAVNIANTGLLYSAAGSLQDINFKGLTSNSNNCVQVTINTDANGGTETNYISVDDYNSLDFTAFPNFCKTYNDNTECEPNLETNTSIPSSLRQKSIVGAEVSVNYMSFGTNYDGKISKVNADETFNIAYDNGENEKNVELINITFKPPSEPSEPSDSDPLIPKVDLNLTSFPTPAGFPDMSSVLKQGFQNQNRHECKNCGKFHLQKNNSYVSSDDEYTSPRPYTESNNGIEYSKINETIEIYPSIISTYYFSAISIIGLYILYNLLYKKK